MNDLNVTLVQPDIIWEDHKRNANHLEELLGDLGKTDLIMLPEMFSTGFTMDPRKVALEDGGEMRDWMIGLARDMNCWVIGSLCVSDSGRFFNRLFAVSPNGVELRADKRHLFSLAGEEKVYSPGEVRQTVTINGWTILPLVCYDLRFPVWSRNDLGYDLLLYVANWPHRRIGAWDTLLPARAIENQSFVVAVNRVGLDGNQVHHSGHSSAFDPLGSRIATLKDDSEEVTTVALSGEELKRTRERFRFLNDRDEFSIEGVQGSR
ncbi:MAG: nitrilase family protein [Bacteroidota bacterium]|nr:nitrilase family protein [Bacteroidota bacterium]